MIRRLVFSIMAICVVISGIFGCGSGRNKGVPDARFIFDQGVELYNREKFFRSVEKFQSVLYNYPGQDIADSAQFLLAMSYFNDADFVLSHTEFSRFLTNYPTSPFFERALLMRAVSLYEQTPRNAGLDQSTLEPAVRELRDFLVDYPESEWREEASSYLLKARTRLAHKMFENAVVYERIRAFDAGRTYFQRVIDDYGDTPLGPKATYKLAELEFRQGSFDSAQVKIDAFMSIYPNHEWLRRAEKLRAKISARKTVGSPQADAGS